MNPLTNGCWVSNVADVRHDAYFTDEAQTTFIYDGSSSFSLGFYGDNARRT